MPAMPVEWPPDREPHAAERGQLRENQLIGHVVADENRPAAGKRRLRHQPANRLAFADARALDLEHRLARQHFQRLAGKFRAHGYRYAGAGASCCLRRGAVMQRQRIALVLDQDAGIDSASRGKLAAAASRASGAAASTAWPGVSRISAPWPPIAGSTSGANRRSRSAIGRPLTSASAPPVAFSEPRQRSAQIVRHTHRVRRGAISISVPSTSSSSAIVFRSSRTKSSGRAGSSPRVCRHCASTSTSPSTPATTLNSRSIDLALVAGDGAVFALGQNHAREGADRFLDDVAAGREHRPGGVGERLAAASRSPA